MQRLSDNKDIDRYPHSLDDGTIGYTRWEYQERHFFEVHSIWAVRPDGTMADAVFKQHLPAPYGSSRYAARCPAAASWWPSRPGITRSPTAPSS